MVTYSTLMKAYIRARKFDKVGTLVTWLQGYMCSNVSLGLIHVMVCWPGP